MDGYRANLGGIEATWGDLSSIAQTADELRGTISRIEADTGREDSTAMACAAVSDAAGLLSRLSETLSRGQQVIPAGAARNTTQRGTGAAEISSGRPAGRA